MEEKRRVMTAEEFLAQDPEERWQETTRILAGRIAHHERRREQERAERERRGRDDD
jgi:hypothetical protein